MPRTAVAEGSPVEELAEEAARETARFDGWEEEVTSILGDEGPTTEESEVGQPLTQTQIGKQLRRIADAIAAEENTAGLSGKPPEETAAQYTSVDNALSEMFSDNEVGEKDKLFLLQYGFKAQDIFVSDTARNEMIRWWSEAQKIESDMEVSQATREGQIHMALLHMRKIEVAVEAMDTLGYLKFMREFQPIKDTLPPDILETALQARTEGTRSEEENGFIKAVDILSTMQYIESPQNTLGFTADEIRLEANDSFVRVCYDAATAADRAASAIEQSRAKRGILGKGAAFVKGKSETEETTINALRNSAVQLAIRGVILEKHQGRAQVWKAERGILKDLAGTPEERGGIARGVQTAETERAVKGSLVQTNEEKLNLARRYEVEKGRVENTLFERFSKGGLKGVEGVSTLDPIILNGAEYIMRNVIETRLENLALVEKRAETDAPYEPVIDEERRKMIDTRVAVFRENFGASKLGDEGRPTEDLVNYGLPTLYTILIKTEAMPKHNAQAVCAAVLATAALREFEKVPTVGMQSTTEIKGMDKDAMDALQNIVQFSRMTGTSIDYNEPPYSEWSAAGELKRNITKLQTSIRHMIGGNEGLGLFSTNEELVAAMPQMASGVDVTSLSLEKLQYRSSTTV